MKTFDLDIDTQTKFNPKQIFNCVRASIIKDEVLTPHPCGVYFQNIAEDSLSKLSCIPYKEAEDLGYFKVDFLHLSIYDHFSSKEEINELIKIDPDWNLLLIPSVVTKLFQLSKHYEVLNKVKPKSIIELADVLALIRPSKRYLLNYYLQDREKYRKELYKKSATEEYAFKKSHAVSYALVVVLQLHLISIGVEF